MPTSINGIPLHPLLVHIPVILLPLVTVSVLLMVVWPAARARFGWTTVVLAFVGFAGTVLAGQSGEDLQDAVERTTDRAAIHQHAELGDQLRLISLMLFLAVLGWQLLQTWSARRTAGPDGTDTGGPGAGGVGSRTILAAGLAPLVIGVLSTVWVIRTGDTGAKQVWKNVHVTAERGGEGGEGGDG
jgi:uncharacterized membrane protein